MRMIWLCTAATAAAVVGGEARAAAADLATVEEIVVTARKSSENLQDTPISITALTAHDMERRGIASLADVATVTPGLNYGAFGDLKLSPTSLRGVVGSAGSAGADPAVGYYVDEVFVGQGPGANLDLYDISQVEVLRGPQGTLYGRNTIGGVINITTERPSDTFRSSLTADFGSYQKRRIGASISGPLIPGLLSGKLAVIDDQRDGYDENVFLHRRVNDHNTWSGRGQLLFTFSPQTELRLSVDHAGANQETLVFETLRYNPATLPPQLLAAGGYGLNTNPYDRKVISNAVTRETLDSTSAAAVFKTTLGAVHLTNIAAYHDHDYFSRDDTCRCQLQFSYDGDPETVRRFSDELRIDGKAGAFSWLAGLYYFRQKTDNQSFIELGSTTAAVFGEPSLTGLTIGSSGRLETTSQAAFVSGSWAFSDRLDVTVGARYTRDRKTIAYVQKDPLALLGGSANIQASGAWGELTPNANLRYRFTPDILGYVTAAKGFKSGGFNDALGDANGIAFGPETLWNYEAGLKAELFDRRLIINTAVYEMRWDQIQITAQNPATTFYNPIILNGGRAHSRGVEIEVTARPSEALLIGANASVQDAAYDEGRLPNGRKLDAIPYAPAYTALVDAEYGRPTALGRVSVYGEYILRGRTYLTTNNDPDGRVSPYGLLNLRLTLASNDDRWRVSLYGRNLGDKTYPTRLFDLYDNVLNGQKFIVLGEPRTFGVELRINSF